jgi:hypothetical protein
MKNDHGHRCVICNPVGSRNRRVGDEHEGLVTYSRAKFKRCEDLTEEDFLDDESVEEEEFPLFV